MHTCKCIIKYAIKPALYIKPTNQTKRDRKMIQSLKMTKINPIQYSMPKLPFIILYLSSECTPWANNVMLFTLGHFLFPGWIFPLLKQKSRPKQSPLNAGTLIFIITSIPNEIKWTHDLVLTSQGHHPSLSEQMIAKTAKFCSYISLRIIDFPFTNNCIRCCFIALCFLFTNTI